MPLETVLLIAFLVVLPLVQHMVKYLRRQSELREQAEGPPFSAGRLPENGEPSPLPRAVRRAKPAATSFTPVARRGHSIDLRRAIVLMTLIGPCRAASPHNWPDRGERP